MSNLGCGARWNKCPPPNSQYANDVNNIDETPNQSPATSPGNKRKKPDDINEKKDSTKTGENNNSQANTGEKENNVDSITDS